ncbi:ribosome assembly cofactor RimP [Daejeonella oryzae]|uniref:ribosome assembly cofactor RimP n=1 Tax=Daejeonella oryzae TaxID=1122943 RepID=UPI0003F94F66|nr:ribosome assembly cofactor RimP [Daejeonella oryzae]
MDIEKRVIELVEEKIADRPDLFIVDVKMHASGLLTILIDGDQGVGIQDCAGISRHVGFYLEEENVIELAYHLEVSSPGLDAPFKSIRQYSKNIGRSVTVKLTDNNSKEAKLLQVEESGITVEENIKEKGKKAQLVNNFIPFDQIAETKVLISFK